MSTFKIVCPYCESVMKSPKPVPAGKKIKCAKCGDLFTTTDPDEEPLPKKKPAAAAGKGAAKAAKPKPPETVKPVDDDDDGGLTYGFVEEDKPKVRGDDDDDYDDDDEEEEEDERTKQRKKDLEFALDTSIKDPRGPAQARVNFPSNVLIAVGALSLFGSFFWILFMLWPFFFADHVIASKVVFKWDTAKTPYEKKWEELSKEEKNQVEAAQWEWIVPMDAKSAESYWIWDVWGIPMRILMICGMLVSMVLSGIVAYGGVKMQMLESWGWAMAASITVIFTVGGAIGLLVGLWCILTLNDEKVKAGFTYKAE